MPGLSYDSFRAIIDDELSSVMDKVTAKPETVIAVPVGDAAARSL